MNAETKSWVLLGILNIPVYLGLGKLIFDDWACFFESIGFWLTPDWISMLRGQWAEDWWGTLKLFVFLGLCAGVVYGEHQMFYGDKPKTTIARLKPCPSTHLAAPLRGTTGDFECLAL